MAADFIDYTSAGSTYTQNFNNLASSGTSSSLPDGWTFLESGTNGNSLYSTSNGLANAGDTYSFGTTGSADRAFGSLQSSSLIPTLGAAIRNSTGSILTSMSISYVGEQWRLGTAGRSDRLDFQYSLNATGLTDGTWIDVNALDFTAPITNGTIGGLDGNLAANRTNRSSIIGSLNIPNGSTVWVRWNDFNATSSDDGLGIDDFAFTANPGSSSNTPPTISTPANQQTPFQTSTPAIAFMVNDLETSATSLVVTAASSNTLLVPLSGIVLGGSGTNRTVTLTPALGQSGSTTISLTVSDGQQTTTSSFQLTVLANSGTTSNLRIISYNISGASGNGSPRTGFETILKAIGTEIVSGISKQVDLFALQEVLSQATTSTIVANSLNNLYGTVAYATGTLNGATTGSGTQGVVYNTQTLQLLGEAVIGTASSNTAPRQTLRHHFRPVGTTGTADFYVYNSHLKAADSSTDATRRFEDVEIIRADADSLGQGTNILYVGDFNLYRSSEPAYQEFLSIGNGQAFDPINRPGNWSGNANFRDIFTQAPSATAQPELGLDGGGLDDRLDFQLISGELNDGTGLEYRPGSYHTFGVNGSVAVNGSIDDPSSTALPGLANRLTVLTLLRTVSDHLPVVADYTFTAQSTNTAPTDITLTGNSLSENQPIGTMVGTFGTIDPNPGNTFSYSLVPGIGSGDNARFSIIGNTLRTSGSIDFEATPSLSIRVRSTDQGGLSTEKFFAIDVTNLSDALVLNRQVFYNRSSSPVFGNGSGNPSGAIDPNKFPLLPGQTASYANYTNFIHGLNGLIVDIDGLNSINASDFRFDTWNGISTSGFVATTATPTITVIANGGMNGSSRVKIEFSNAAIRNTWLRVTVLANSNTDLANHDVFYFGNAVGDLEIGNTGTPILVQTNATDLSAIQQNQSTAANSVAITSIYDVNKDGRVNATDTSLVRQNQGANLLRYITAPLSLSASASSSSIAFSLTDSSPKTYQSKQNDPTTRISSTRATAASAIGSVAPPRIATPVIERAEVLNVLKRKQAHAAVATDLCFAKLLAFG